MTLFDPSSREALIASVTERLSKRRRSVFQLAGEDACRIHVEATVIALERDCEAGNSNAMREACVAFVTSFLPEGLGYSDVRFFAKILRKQAHELAREDRRAAIEQWCYDYLGVCSTHYMVQRDDVLQREAAKREIERYESQLEALRVALDEKTQLLELIRQASTPMAPVVPGILVVPLVGTFDRFRAEILTERLLDEITRARARVTILDISGVPVFDTDAAQLIIRLANTVRLIGAKVILVGISPENARTIVQLGIELDGVLTCRGLQDGLREALASQNLQIVSIA